MDRLHEIQPITDYADTAFTGTMESKNIPPRANRGLSSATVLPNGTRCHEYLAVDSGPDRLESQYSDFIRPLKHREGHLMERLLARDKVELPRGYVYYNWFGMVSTWVKGFRSIFMVMSWMLLMSCLIIIPLFWILDVKIAPKTALSTLLLFLLVPALYLIFRIIDDLELATWLDPDPSAKAIFRRDSGFVILHRWFKRTPAKFPFTEAQCFNRLIPINNVSLGFSMEISHKRWR